MEEKEVVIEENEKGEGKAKSNVLLGIIALALTLILIALIFFMLSQQNGAKGNEKKNDVLTGEQSQENVYSSIKTEKWEITTEQIERLTDFFVEYFPIMDMTNIKNQDLLTFALTGVSGDSFTEEDIELVLKEYFGNSVKVKHEDILCQIDQKPLYIYKDGIYTSNTSEHGHEGRWSFELYTQFISAQKENNILTLNYKIMYGYPVPYLVASTYYSGYKDKKVVMELESSDRGLESPTSYLLTESFKKTGITSFTYEIDSEGTYSLKSITEK